MSLRVLSVLVTPVGTSLVTKPIACYLRISTKDQNTEGQETALMEWLQGSGIDPEAVTWYRDVESGRKLSRPALDRLKTDIHAGRVKNVVVWKLDRLARRLREGLDLLCDWSERGIRFVSVTQAIDVNGTLGRMVASLLLGVAEIEWEYRRERQRLGIDAAKKKGIYRGRLPETRKGEPLRAKELRAKGLNPQEIATALNISRRTVFRYLKST